jgi:uncharacterized protein YjbI with pentapeptide repeats
MASPWTKPTGRIALVTFAAVAEVFVVLAFLWAINDNFRRTAGEALNSAAVLIVGPLLDDEQRANDQHSGAQPGQQPTTEPAQPQTATQPTEQPFSDEVTKGVNQLASGEMTVRLDGIHTLEGVMNASLEYQEQVLGSLCAFVRDGTIGTVVHDKPATDIQAALTAIGKRKRGPGKVNLARAVIDGADLRGANLSGGADLTGAHLRGADLNGAYLSNADLVGVDLSDADLSKANLSGAGLLYADLRGADLANADLESASLNGARLGLANLSKVNLRRAEVSGAHLGGANLVGARLGLADLSGADLGRANLSDADLSSANGLTQDQLDKACGKPKTLPPGLTLDKPCPPRPEAR